jgi:hypothetical protein
MTKPTLEELMQNGKDAEDPLASEEKKRSLPRQATLGTQEAIQQQGNIPYALSRLTQGIGAPAYLLSDAAIRAYNLATGGKTPTFTERLQASTAKPTGVGERFLGAGLEGVGGAVSGGALLKGIGAATQSVSPALSEAAKQLGRITTPLVTGGATSGVVTEAVRGTSAYQNLSPAAKVLIDLGVGIPSGMAGGYVGGKLAGVTGRNIPQEMQDVRQTLERQGVPYRAGDIAGPGSRLTAAEAYAAEVPFSGMRSAMTQTAEAFKGKLNELKDRLVIKGDANRAMAEDMRSQYKSNKTTASKLFQAVPDNEQVALVQTNAAAKSLLDQFPDVFTLAPVSKQAQGLIKQAAQASGPKTSVILGPNGQPIQTAPIYDYSDARRLASDIGAMVRQTSTDPKYATVHGALKNLYASIQGDFDNWAQSTSNQAAAQSYKDAMTYFATNVAPYRDSSILNKIVSSKTNKADYDEGARRLFESVFSSGDVETANLAIRLMGAKGREAAGSKLAERAITPATTEAMAAPVSNARFLQGLRVDDPVTDIILNANPILKSQVNDLTTIADATRRAVAAYAQPRTGIMNTPALTIGGGTTVGGMVGGTPGAIVGAVAPTVAGQTLTQLSSSQSLINRLLGNAGQNLLLTQPQNVRGGALIAPTASATGGLLNEPFRLDVSGTADTMSDEEKILAGLLQ